jgi:anionic cell wall polymer biosynthesis LytR-Cps2A-Psr (LCP) family protein
MKPSLCFLHQWTGVALSSQHGGQNYPTGPGSYDYQQPGMQDQDQAKDDEPKEDSFLGILKGLFGKGKNKEGKGSSDTMMVGDLCLNYIHP